MSNQIAEWPKMCSGCHAPINYPQSPGEWPKIILIYIDGENTKHYWHIPCYNIVQSKNLEIKAKRRKIREQFAKEETGKEVMEVD